MTLGTESLMMRRMERSASAEILDGMSDAAYECLILLAMVVSWAVWHFYFANSKNSKRQKKVAPPIYAPPVDKLATDGKDLSTQNDGGRAELSVSAGEIDEHTLRQACEVARGPESVRRCAAQISMLAGTRYSTALRLFRLMGRLGSLRHLRDGGQLYSAMFSAAVRVGHPEVAEEILLLIKKFNAAALVNESDFFRSALKLLASKRYFEQCVSVFTLFGPDLEEEAKGDDAHGWPKGYLPKDKVVFSCVAFAAAELGQVALASRVVECMRQADLELSHKDFITLFRAQGKRGDWKAAVEHLQRLRQNGETVDPVLANVVLGACVSGKRFDVAQDILRDMEQGKLLGAPPDVVSYNTVLKGLAVGGRIDDCYDLFMAMQKDGSAVVPDEVTHSILLDACVSHHDMHRASDVLKGMIQSGVRMTTVLGTTLIKGLVKAKMLDKAMILYETMKKAPENSERPATVGAMLSSAQRADDDVVSGNASSNFNKQQGASGASRDGEDGRPDLVTMSLLIKANCDDRKLDVALQILEDMGKANLLPDDLLLNHLLEGCCYAGNAEEAMNLFDTLPVRGGFAPSVYTVSSMLKVFGKCRMVDKAMDLLVNMKEKYGLAPTVVTYTCVMSGCVRNKCMKEALQAFSHMKAAAVRPDKYTFSTLLNGCCHSRDNFSAGLELCKEALENTDSNDKHNLEESFNNLFSQMLESEEKELARELYKLLVRHGVKVRSPTGSGSAAPEHPYRRFGKREQ